jgi:hypothetical protein
MQESTADTTKKKTSTRLPYPTGTLHKSVHDTKGSRSMPSIFSIKNKPINKHNILLAVFTPPR